MTSVQASSVRWRFIRIAVGVWAVGALTFQVCTSQSRPLLILIGENDDWTPAEPCRKLAEAAKKAGYPVTIKVYPGAHHSFDSSNPVRYVPTRVNSNSASGRGATTGGDPKAWEDSIREVTAFFGHHLKKTENQCLK